MNDTQQLLSSAEGDPRPSMLKELQRDFGVNGRTAIIDLRVSGEEDNRVLTLLLNGKNVSSREIASTFGILRTDLHDCVGQKGEHTRVTLPKNVLQSGFTHLYKPISFPLERNRGQAPEYHMGGLISAARVGKSGDGFIEDNGVGKLGFVKQELTQNPAARILKDIFYDVRASALPAYANEHASTTAAMAITTIEGVVWRNAGDSAVLAVGGNGKAILLNELQSLLGRSVLNVLRPGTPSTKDIDGFQSWDQLQAKLGSEKIRIATVSDGISKSFKPADLVTDVEYLIRYNQIHIDSPDWAGELLYVSLAKNFPNYKNDDKIVVSTLRPYSAFQQAMIGAFDGVGSGYKASAEIAHSAVTLSLLKLNNLSLS